MAEQEAPVNGAATHTPAIHITAPSPNTSGTLRHSPLARSSISPPTTAPTTTTTATAAAPEISSAIADAPVRDEPVFASSTGGSANGSICASPSRVLNSPPSVRAAAFATSTPTQPPGTPSTLDSEDKQALTAEDRAALERMLHLFTSAAPRARTDSPSRPSPVEIDDEHIEPEPQQGNMEYKLKLIDPSPTRFQHLVTQMRWRLAEGNGDALYVIGVEDDGYLTGLSKEELEASLKTLEAMAVAAGAAITPLRVRTSVRGAGQVAEVLVRRVPDDQEFIDVRIAAIGSAGAGKSTLLGVLAGGEMDNGHGRARVSLFRHRHEVASGQTSSISREIIGFDSAGAVVNHALPSGHAATAAAICESASKVVSFYDFPGHEKYLKTTLRGFSGHAMDGVALVLNATGGMPASTLTQMELVLGLHLPFFVIVTKIDACTRAALTATLKELTQYLKSPGCKRVPVLINNTDDVCVLNGSSFAKGHMVPIFLISSVTGKNLDLLRQFLNLLTPTQSEELALSLPAYLQINEVFDVHDVGPVVAGTLEQGVIRVGDELQLGPSDTGEYSSVVVRSIHRNRKPYHLIKAGQHASFAVSNVSRAQLRRGQVLLARKLDCTSCTEFEADVMLTSGATPLKCDAQVTVFIGAVRQAACVLAQTARRVRLRFLTRPEHVAVGARVLVHDQRIHGFGRIVAAPAQHSTTSRAAAAAAAEHAAASEVESNESAPETA
eukprot:m.234927 g.234927  ORF g.234927 m.234927 type:complete len:723 (+) comp19841_c0_seq1:354-2522(+)